MSLCLCTGEGDMLLTGAYGQQQRDLTAGNLVTYDDNTRRYCRSGRTDA
jgi:predicted 2-oxoglutarate/Fe(II)-dependent dioxygenase YbiX